MARDDKIKYWAEEAWWNEPQYLRPGEIDSEIIQTATSTMMWHFDRNWWDEMMADPGPNAVAPELLARGLAPLGFILGLGTSLDALSTAQGFSRKVSELKSKGMKSEKTLFEVLVAAKFAQAGCKVHFPKECTTPVPDIRVMRGNDELAVECKDLEKDEWEQWGAELMSLTTHSLPSSHNGNPIVVQIEYDPRLSEIRTREEAYGERPKRDYSYALVAAIARHIEASVVQTLARNPEIPHEFVVDGVAKVRLLPNDSGEYSSVMGCGVSPTAQLRRILQKGLFKAYPQLPKDVPGLVVVKNTHMPNAALARLTLDVVTSEGPPELQQVAGLLIIPPQYLFYRRSAMYFPNKTVVLSPGIQEIIQAIVSAANAEIF